MDDDRVAIPYGVSPGGVPLGANGLPRVVITPPEDTRVTVPYDTAPDEAPPRPDHSKKKEGEWNDKRALLGTALLRGPADLAGLPGTLGRLLPEDTSATEPGPFGGEYASPEGMKHMPSGEDIMNWMFHPSGPLAGMRRDPNPESTFERVTAGATTALATPFSGPKIAAMLGGGLGSWFETMSKDHPALANFAGQMTGLLFGHGIGQVKRALPEVVHDIAGGTPEQRVGRSINELSGAPENEMHAKLSSPNDVAGSEQTTAQKLNTANARTLEDEAKKMPGGNNSFQERAAAQDEARKTEAGTIAPGGDVNAPGKHYNEMQGAIEQHLTNLEKSAADEARKRITALGPSATPEEAGRVIRQVAEEHYKAAEGVVDKAYTGVIQPNRAEKVMVDPSPAVRRIDKRLNDNYPKTNRVGEYKTLEAFRDAVANNGEPLSYREMMGLVKRAGNEGYKLSGDNRKMMLDFRDIVLQRMEASASDVGKLPPPLQKFSTTAEGAAFNEARTNADRLTRLNELRDIEGQDPLKGWKGSRKDLDARIKETELRMRDEAGVKGNMNPDEYARMIDARDLKEAMKDKYDRGAMGKILDKGGQIGGVQVTDSGVPGKFWHSNEKTVREDMGQFINEFGSQSAASSALREHVVGRLKAEFGAEGENLTQAKLGQYLKQHAAALDTEVGAPIKKELTNLQTAREAITNQSEQLSNTLEAYNKSAAQHFFSKRTNGQIDPEAAISSALAPSNKDRVRDMTQLATLAKGSPEATEGLKAMVRDDFLKAASTGGKMTEGVLDGAKAKNWMDTNRAAISKVLEPEHVNSLERITNDLNKLDKSTLKNTEASTVAGNLHEILTGKFAMGDDLAIGKYGKLGAKIIGGILGANFKSGEITKVQDLFKEAMLNPELARTLAMKATPGNVDGIVNKIKTFVGSASGRMSEAKKYSMTGPTVAATANSADRGTNGQ